METNLSKYLRARRPIVWVHSGDYKEVDAIVKEATKEYKNKAIFEYRAFGAVNFETKVKSDEVVDLYSFLNILFSEGVKTNVFLIIKNAEEEMKDARNIALIKKIAETRYSNSDYNFTVIVVTKTEMIPKELEKFTSILDIPNMTKDEIEKVEQEVNKQIWNALEIKTEEMPIAEARKLGAQALFGEKYGDIVRVVSIGDYSIELCGGTHNSNSSEVGIFKVISETGVAAGVRRIEALTGRAAYEYLRQQEETLRTVEKLTKANASNVVEKVINLQTEIKKLSKEKESLQQKIANAELNNLVNNIKEVNGINVLTSLVESENMNHLKQLVDNAKSKLENYIIAFASINDDKVNFVVAVDKAITDKYNAGKLVNILATVCEGRGGGRPDMAQAGAKNKDNIDKAFEELIANI